MGPPPQPALSTPHRALEEQRPGGTGWAPSGSLEGSSNLACQASLNGEGAEPADLAGVLTLQGVDQGDLDGRGGQAEAGQRAGQGPAEGGRVDRGADDQDLGAGRGLADLVLDDPPVAAEQRGEDVRVDEPGRPE